MDLNTVLGLLDEQTRINAYKQSMSKLESSPNLDLDALKLCIKLRPSPESAPGDANRLFDLLTQRIPHEPLDSDHFFHLAEIFSIDGAFMDTLFRKILPVTGKVHLPELSKRLDEQAESSAQQNIRKATAYLTLSKCSYWLPSSSNHFLVPFTLNLLSNFLGSPDLDGYALDAISALLSLLRREKQIVVASAYDTPTPWLKSTSNPDRATLAEPIVNESFWNRLSALGLEYIMSSECSSKIFRTWFQWISQVVSDHVHLTCLNDASYWDTVRHGLYCGHADQRKFCIGIIRQSLLAARTDICTPTMRFRVGERLRYIKAYEQYSNLFETIVLDRYANQVQACLPELTRLLKSDITPEMASTLLSAALNPMVQEGIRKIIGNWYIDYVIKVRGDLVEHTSFLLDGFLPWATTGDLFTSTLRATREATTCLHGASLADVIARFIAEASISSSPAQAGFLTARDLEPTKSGRRIVLIGVLDYILDARGKIFQFAILYLLEGLVKGLSGGFALRESLNVNEVDKILRISRLPGLPEIAGHLYAQYCQQLCIVTATDETLESTPGYQQLRQQVQKLAAPMESSALYGLDAPPGESPSLQTLRKQLEDSQHRMIQGERYGAVCQSLISILDRAGSTTIDPADLYVMLDALWEEADRRLFVRSVAVYVPSLMFHPCCVRVLAERQLQEKEGGAEDDLQALLCKAMLHLQQLSEGRTYILSILATSIRQAAFSSPRIMRVLPFEGYITRFLNHPPIIRPEFLFEVAAAEKLQQHFPHRTYATYYGQREWVAYAAMIDLLRRFPSEQRDVAKNILNTLLEPWKSQKAGAPIISKWKNAFQLQAMLILADHVVSESEVDMYLASFRHALIMEAWPRYRFQLEWIIARIYLRFPGKTSQLLSHLSSLDESSSSHIASLMKLAVLVAPHDTEDFSTTFMTQLVPFAASPKVQIRHESNYAIPIIFDLAVSKGWRSITENIAFMSLNTFIRSLDKFQSAPWTIRTLKLDPVRDFTLVNIFEGQYLTIESPEKNRVACDDFLAFDEADRTSGLNVPPERILLGDPVAPIAILPTRKVASRTIDEQASPAFFQTKSGFDLDSLHPQSGPPSLKTQRPASVILVASLIDNPTNLGGLSRISESFGMEALYIDDLKKTAHKDFKATSVTSEKHLPIRELKVAGVPAFLIDMKRSGYEVVGIEQTDRSGILGLDTDKERLGTLPKKCVLVLGSEKGGISAEVLAVLDRCVEIRTVGVTRSLNVQTAGGIAVYEWWREWHGRS